MPPLTTEGKRSRARDKAFTMRCSIAIPPRWGFAPPLDTNPPGSWGPLLRHVGQRSRNMTTHTSKWNNRGGILQINQPGPTAHAWGHVVARCGIAHYRHSRMRLEDRSLIDLGDLPKKTLGLDHINESIPCMVMHPSKHPFRPSPNHFSLYFSFSNHL